MTRLASQRRWIRGLLGVAISAAFLVATLSRVDVAEVGAALARVSAGGILLAILVVLLELVLRSVRWQRLLAPVGAVPLRRAVAYLGIGYFANSLLPARLGDLARAYLAGRSFGISRLAVLGTIVVERLADGLFILALVGGLGLATAPGSVASAAGWLAALVVVGAAGFLVVLIWVRSSDQAGVRLRVRGLVERVLLGAQAVREPAGLAVTVLLTAAAFGAAVTSFSVLASAAGVHLTPVQAAVAMGGLALSTSIPAAPGSIGTYEFVGLTILTWLGIPAETALAIVVLVHLVATLPLATLGMIAAWHFHFRVSEIAQDAEPAVAISETGERTAGAAG